MLPSNNTTVNTQAIVIDIFKTTALILPMTTAFLIANAVTQSQGDVAAG
jgi:hypothetical protein